MITAIGFDEQGLRSVVNVLVRLVESAGAVVIFAGATVAFVGFVAAALRSGDPDRFVPVRLGLGRFLALGLEFQLASDILRTAVAPSFKELGQLAAVATIRTALNFFLGREIRAERDQLEARDATPPAGGPGSTGGSRGGASGATARR